MILMNYALEVRDLRFSYPGMAPVVEGFSLALAEGEKLGRALAPPRPRLPAQPEGHVVEDVQMRE